MHIPTTVFGAGSSDGSGSSVRYSAQGLRIDPDGVAVRVGKVIRQLERAAEAQDSGSITMQAGINELPSPMRDLAGQPEVAASLADYAGDYGATTGDLVVAGG
ncbi:MAG: hypothetical protein K0U67_02460 [Actinomycetia bacterium]|nr:hypothetical protein [Actinomycetes bacterium]